MAGGGDGGRLRGKITGRRRGGSRLSALGARPSGPSQEQRAEKRELPKKLPLSRRADRSRYATAPAPRGARWIFPAARHRVHTFTFSIFPFTTTRATWRLGFQVRRVLLLACETLFPKVTPLSHTKQRLRLMAI